MRCSGARVAGVVMAMIVLAGIAACSPAGPQATSTRTPAPADTPAPVETGTAIASAPGAGAWDYCAAVGTIDEPDAQYSTEAAVTAIQDALAIAEELPQRFADPRARGLPIPWRCMGGEVWACDPGANLPCGAADTSDEPTEGMRGYCAENPDGVLPAFVTGHESIYAWACSGGQAVIERQPFHADERGFVAEFWYRLDRPG